MGKQGLISNAPSTSLSNANIIEEKSIRRENYRREENKKEKNIKA